MKVKFLKKKIIIPTYKEEKEEELPLFAFNRVHQRTSGDPYPNKVVLEAKRDELINQEYELLVLENEFIELGILPRLGGKIYYAYDKKKKYDFIYRNDVIKPALIGVLGSWTSGGMEFNWPFHHRASTFKDVDYSVEYGNNYITVWLSEVDPIDRMKGMVGISLKEDECIFETKVKLDNLNPIRKSFLWWENTAVSVNKNYEIFFPSDVNYVNFHYKRSVTPYPIANTNTLGAFNGIYYNEDIDISKHKNTIKATSYFAAPSEFDYFGGYDHELNAGICHVASHHISPGKKMFTWGYSQLEETWEKALTNKAGAYAELMAGVFSDNQPDLSYLLPYESRCFSQFWFPLHDAGIPLFSSTDLSFFYKNDTFLIQANKKLDNLIINVNRNGNNLLSVRKTLKTYVLSEIFNYKLLKNDIIEIIYNGDRLVRYVYLKEYKKDIPPARKEYPQYKDILSAYDMYNLALHFEQYRSPDYDAEKTYLKSLLLDGEFAPSYIALSRISYLKYDFVQAKKYIDKGISLLTKYNNHPICGEAYFLKGLISSALDNYDEAYDYFLKTLYNEDYAYKGLFEASLIDIKRKDYYLALTKLNEAINKNRLNPIFPVIKSLVLFLKGENELAKEEINKTLSLDKLNIFALIIRSYIFNDYKDLLNIKTDLNLNLLDMNEILFKAGLMEVIKTILINVKKYKDLNMMNELILNYINNTDIVFNEVGLAFPSRIIELKILEGLINKDKRNYKLIPYLGIMYYGKRNYNKGHELFTLASKNNPTFENYRLLAISTYTYLSDYKEAFSLYKKGFTIALKVTKEMVFEYVYLAYKNNVEPFKIISFILKYNLYRDDIVVELAKAYSKNNEPNKAINTLLNRDFVAAEGGEHYIADQYMYAYYLLGVNKIKNKDYEGAIKEFNNALTLPSSLGSGLWNDVRKFPFYYFIAMSFDKLKNKNKAKEYMNKIIGYNFDYFTNMYLSTYRYYLARAKDYLNKNDEGQQLILKGIKEDLASLKNESQGFAYTTPFFIPYIDNNELYKKRYYGYRLYLYYLYINNQKKTDYYKRIILKDSYMTYMLDPFYDE